LTTKEFETSILIRLIKKKQVGIFGDSLPLDALVNTFYRFISSGIGTSTLNMY
jgi:hypothetical protein